MAIDNEYYAMMQSAYDTGASWLMYLGLAALAVIAFAAVAPFLSRVYARVWSRASRFARFVFCAAFAVALMHGGAKSIYSGGIHFPATDTTSGYIADAGSYVTNDAIYVSFKRNIAPETAPLLIDYREIGKTDADDWVNLITTTFADFENPQRIAFANATNYSWIVYTTWTPGSSVETNGVWHAYWGVDQKTGEYMIPVRTTIRLAPNATIAPPSKKTAK